MPLVPGEDQTWAVDAPHSRRFGIRLGCDLTGFFEKAGKRKLVAKFANLEML
jgi:hypothetical protein